VNTYKFADAYFRGLIKKNIFVNTCTYIRASHIMTGIR
jgi:hypothetical protein